MTATGHFENCCALFLVVLALSQKPSKPNSVLQCGLEGE